MGQEREACADIGPEATQGRGLEPEQVSPGHTDQRRGPSVSEVGLDGTARIHENGGRSKMKESEQTAVELDTHRNKEDYPVSGTDTRCVESSSDPLYLFVELVVAQLCSIRLDERAVI
jgi:hypothetical protein